LRKKRIHPPLENLVIEKAAAEGKGLGYAEDMVVFVKYSVPGDIINAKIFNAKKNFAEAEITSIVKASDKRVTPHCQHFGTCGGCTWQYMDYQEQLKWKNQQAKDALERIGKIEVQEYLPIVGADKTTHYRNKLDYSFSCKAWLTKEDIQNEVSEYQNALGFHISGRFDKVLNIDECWHQADPSNQIRNHVKDFCDKNEYPFFDPKTHDGLMRNLIIRNTTLNEWMVILIFKENEEEKIELLLSNLKENFPQITSLMYGINGKGNDSIYDIDLITYHGNDHITEQLGDIRFKIRPKSFFQTNSFQAKKLYDITKEFAGLKPTNIVYDLYTGTGTIANYVASDCKKIIGIESVPQAIEDAIENSEHNKIMNTEFLVGDMKDVFNDAFIQKHGKADVLITDPPRAGMHPDVVKKILEIEPERIVYVSCNPATQARDLEMMQHKYKVIKSQAVDMFPHTHHVENVVLMERI